MFSPYCQGDGARGLGQLRSPVWQAKTITSNGASEGRSCDVQTVRTPGICPSAIAAGGFVANFNMTPHPDRA